MGYLASVERVLTEGDGGSRTVRARDRVSHALTELVMHDTPKTKPEKLPGEMDDPGKGALAADKATKGAPGPRRAKEISHKAAQRSPGPRGGSPKRKGLSTAKAQRGASQGRTRGGGAIGEGKIVFPRSWSSSKKGRSELKLAGDLARDNLIATTKRNEILWAQKAWAFADQVKGAGVSWWEEAERAQADIGKWLMRNGFPIPAMRGGGYFTEGLDEVVTHLVTPSALRTQSAKITQKLGEAYNAVIGFKGMLDTAEEIPNSLGTIYERTGFMMQKIADAKAVAYQSEMELRRMFR